MNDEKVMGTIMDQYCLATSLSSTLLNSPRQFQFNYEQHNLDLVQDSPLRLEGSARIGLNVHAKKLEANLEETITSRDSRRKFSPESLNLNTLAKLLYLGNGIRAVSSETSGQKEHRRNVPSAGNLGSTEIYCIALNVEGLKQGMYHFDSLSHELVLLHQGDFEMWLDECVFLQHEASKAAAVLILAGSLSKLAHKYQLRSYQLALLDAGHVSQNILLAATAMDLAIFPTAGFINSELDNALALNGLDQRSVLALCVGNTAAHKQMSI